MPAAASRTLQRRRRPLGRMKFMSGFRQSIAARVDLVAGFVALAISASGATAALVLGKIFLACVLGVVAVGVVTRVSRQYRNVRGKPASRDTKRGGT